MELKKIPKILTTLIIYMAATSHLQLFKQGYNLLVRKCSQKWIISHFTLIKVYHCLSAVLLSSFFKFRKTDSCRGQSKPWLVFSCFAAWQSWFMFCAKPTSQDIVSPDITGSFSQSLFTLCTLLFSQVFPLFKQHCLYHCGRQIHPIHSHLISRTLGLNKT